MQNKSMQYNYDAQYLEGERNCYISYKFEYNTLSESQNVVTIACPADDDTLGFVRGQRRGIILLLRTLFGPGW